MGARRTRTRNVSRVAGGTRNVSRVGFDPGDPRPGRITYHASGAFPADPLEYCCEAADNTWPALQGSLEKNREAVLAKYQRQHWGQLLENQLGQKP